MSNPFVPIRVLVVDCNGPAAEIVAILLGAHGFKAKAECGKEEALATAKTFSPDAVLVNLGHDNHDAFELAAALRSIPDLHDVYIVALDDMTMPPEFREKNVRFDARLMKPSGYRSLIDTLKRKFDVS